MYEKYLKCIFLLIICIGCRANTIKQSALASNYRAPQLPPIVQNAVERSAEMTSNPNDDHHYHHHQYYYIDGSMPKYHQIDEQLLLAQRNQLAQKRIDTNKSPPTLQYKPRIGEILAKDSILYNGNETPVTRQYTTIQLKPATIGQLRRSNLWPIVDNTVTSLATKAAASANAVKNLLKIGFVNTFDNVNAAVEHKRQRIKSYLIQAAQDHQFALQQAAAEEEHLQQQQQQQQQQQHHQQFAAGHQLGINQPQYPFKSAITQQIPLTSHSVGTAGAHQSSLLLKPLQHLIPLKQQLTQNIVQHIAKHLKRPRIKKPTAPIIVYTSKTKPLPTTTISEDYIHTYDNNYIPPKFFDDGKNPYADMGVTSYKHFEDTILKELEEKEERKVEATIHTMLDDDKYVTNESLEGTKPGISQLAEWSPINSNSNNDDLSSNFFGQFTSPAPILNVENYIQSTFDRPFNDVRPVCEHIDDIVVQPTLFVYPATAESQTTAKQQQQAASNDDAVTIKSNAPNQITNSTTTEKQPNYPAYFIKQQQQLKKLQHKLIGEHRTKQPIHITNKIQQRNKYNFKSRNTMQRQSSTTTTTTTGTTNDQTIPTTELPTTTYDDDGFQPIDPSTELLRSNKFRKFVHNKFNGTIGTFPSTVRPKTSASIQAQASHVSIAIVSPSNARTTSSSSNGSQYTRNASKKQTKLTKDSTNGTNSTATAKSYQNINKNQFRGSIKFSDSLHESP